MLETKRLILRPWEDGDAEDLYRCASSPLVGPAAGWPAHTSVEDSMAIIRGVLSAPETYAVVPRATGRAAGSVGLTAGGASHLGLPDTQGELGYWIGVPFWGQGLIPEAAEALLRRGFLELGLEEIWCGYFDGNGKSRRVQEKCGFVYRYTRERVPCSMLDETRTEHIASLTRADWARRQAGGSPRG